ncbi:MAG TPA: tetratricopeptide repeat protein [candidate division Zixibacteria bacterium]
MKKMKFKIGLVFLSFFLILNSNIASGEPGTQLTIAIKEGISGDSSSFKLIDQREIKLHNGLETASFQANFTLTTTAAIVDSESVVLNMILITLPPQPQTILKEVLAQDNVPFLLGEVDVKSGRVFQVYLTPRMVDLPPPECDLDTRMKDEEEWDELPSSHFFYRYILKSLADLQWSTIKGHTEAEYKRFRETFGFTQPAMDRMEYYLLPCHVNEIAWDQRFNMGLDPTKNKIYTIYTLFEKSLDSPGIGFLLFYRLWGYAPPMLTEGIGNYFSLSHYYTKKLIASKKWVPLSQLELTRNYRNLPPEVAFWEAGSFVRFLVKSYNLDKFKHLYQKATDLTLDQVIQEVYQKNLSVLEKEWLSYLKTQQDSISDFYYLAGMKTTNGHLDDAIELYRDMLGLYGKDNAGILRSLAYVNYLKGDYDQAEKYYMQVLSADTLNLEYMQNLGNIAGIQGDYDKAKRYYLREISLDSTYVDARIKLAEVQTITGDLLLAKDNLVKIETSKMGSQYLVEIYSNLGTIYRKLGEAELAQTNFDKTLFYGRRFVVEFPDSPVSYLKLGEAFFNKGELDSAINFYKIAEFLENKPFYRGKILLAMGKAYQQKKEEAKAQEYLQEVSNIPSGYEEKKEAQKFLIQNSKSGNQK